MSTKTLLRCYIIVNILLGVNPLFAIGNGDLKTAGFRASRVMPMPFPQPLYWSRVGHIIADKFDNTTPAGIWIVSTYLDNGQIQLHFPRPANSNNYSNISFSYYDKSEAYLDEFDSTGVKVWLQVESGDADVDTLIKLVMDRYKHHPCVTGFGVDVEWYHNSAANIFGKQVTDEEAQRWENRVTAYDTSHTLFLKHFVASFMPLTYRGKIIFINDSQDFSYLGSMVSEFIAWGKYFSNNLVGFQIGYDYDPNGDGRTDKNWWSQLDDPVKIIGDRLLGYINNCVGVYWVDFTIKDIFPVDSITGINQEIVSLPDGCQLFQNYPNPFNPSTSINFSLSKGAYISIKIFDVLGNEICVLSEQHYAPGSHLVRWHGRDDSGHDVSSGVYFYRLTSDDFTDTKKCLLVR